MSYKLINANNITFNSDGFITAKNIEKMPCIYADLPNGMDGEHYVLEQEPKTGHWVRQTDDYHDYYECEYCGIAVGLDDIKNYCPNCGAKMEEVEE
jgi:rubrerythrin